MVGVFLDFFAKLLKVPRSSVTIASGQTSRNKVIRVVNFGPKTDREGPGDSILTRPPVSVLGIPVAFAILVISAVWAGRTQKDGAITFLIFGMVLLAICTVGTLTSVLRRGRVYHWLRPETRPRRWVLILLMITFAVFCIWFPVWMTWPHAFVSRALMLLFLVSFFVSCMVIKWFSFLVDRLVKRLG